MSALGLMTDISAGADAMTDLVEQPAIRSDIESKSAIEKATADEKVQEAAGRKQYAQTLASLTAKDAATKTETDPLSKATQMAEEGGVWSDMTQMHDLTSQYQKDQADYNNMLKASSSLQGKDLETNESMLEKKRAALANEKEKMITLQQQVSDARLYQMSKINDETSLQGARQWEAQQLGKLFEKQVPIQDGESQDEYNSKKEHFIKTNDQLPKKYDAVGQAQLNNMITEGGSAKSALEIMKIGIQSDRNIVELQKAQIMAQARIRAADKMAQAHEATDRSRYAAQFVSNARMQLESNDRNIKQSEKQLADFQKQIPPDETTGGILGMGSSENPQYTAYQQSISQIQDQIAAYKKSNLDIMQQASLSQIDLSQMGQLSATGDWLRGKGSSSPPSKPTPKQLSQEDQQAKAWAEANPNDPRSKKILDSLK